MLTALGLSDDAEAADAGAAGEGAAAAAAGSSGGSSSGALAALAGSAEARGHVFSALAQLANRMPDLFQVRAGRCSVGGEVDSKRWGMVPGGV